MIANFKTKTISWLAVFSVLVHIFGTGFAEDEQNGTVVMRIIENHSNNGSVEIRPRMLLKQHVLERTGEFFGTI